MLLVQRKFDHSIYKRVYLYPGGWGTSGQHFGLNKNNINKTVSKYKLKHCN